MVAATPRRPEVNATPPSQVFGHRLVNCREPATGRRFYPPANWVVDCADGSNSWSAAVSKTSRSGWGEATDEPARGDARPTGSQ